MQRKNSSRLIHRAKKHSSSPAPKPQQADGAAEQIAQELKTEKQAEELANKTREDDVEEEEIKEESIDDVHKVKAEEIKSPAGHEDVVGLKPSPFAPAVQDEVQESSQVQIDQDEKDDHSSKPPAHEPLEQKPSPRPPAHPVLEPLSGPPSTDPAPRASRNSKEGKKPKRKKSKPGPPAATPLAPLKHKGKLAILERVETGKNLKLEEETIVPFQPPKDPVTTSQAASSMGITLMNKREKDLEQKKTTLTEDRGRWGQLRR